MQVRHFDLVADDGQIGMLGMETGQRIDLDKIRSAASVVAHVDPSGIATAENPPGLKRNRLGFPDLGIIF
jgi:hypothetical protein